MPYTSIISEGNLIPSDLLEQIALGEAEGQRPEDFGFAKSQRLTDEIAAAWSDARSYWDLFQRRVETLTRQGRLRDDDPATSITREFWVERLLEALGYKLTAMRSAALVQARTYFISHRAGADESAPPIHVEGIRTRLDQRPPSGRPRLSPHALMQEYLNATEHLWGIVTNGERLRLLRDSSRTTRPTFLEFDLRAMLEGEKFSEFAVLYRLLHRSRLPQAMDDAPRCLLERYHQQAIEAGGRVRDGLRDGVEQALLALGNGLLQHPANAALREKVAAGSLPALEFYRQLLRLVYRLLFLMVAEERGLIGGDERGLKIYRNHYSIGRLRRLAEQRAAGQARHGDLWLSLLATFRLLQDDEGAQALGLHALDGDLFGPNAVPDMQNTRLSNEALMLAIRALSLYRDPQGKALRRVNYGALDVEELGSVYESLLDFRPVITGVEPQRHRDTEGERETTESPRLRVSVVKFDLVSGTERKTTGSYYTRPELVHELIKSALEPVLEERLKAATTDHRPPTTAGALGNQSSVVGRRSSAQEDAILSIRVCDPACGSGHFLLAAARRLGRELARVRSGEDQPAPQQFRLAMREVIARCIYGVDANPLAVDLCKVALWIESLSPGMPLSFLDAHIRWGNSLIGARRDLVEQGIPDEAFQPVTGDDKAAASAFRKRNAKERKAKASGQAMLPLDFGGDAAPALPGGAARQLNTMPDDSVRAVREKAAAYARMREAEYGDMLRFNLWTAAFFVPLTDAGDPSVPTSASLDDVARQPSQHNLMVKRAFELAAQIGFFHWELEFPEVFEPTTDHRPPTTGDAGRCQSSAVGGRSPGFDVVLGNPPWERIKLQEQEHWVDVPEIAQAANKAARERKIGEWRNGDARQRARVAEFDTAKYRAEAESRFVRASARFPLTAVGDVNTYALFAEHARDLLAPTGRAGIIVPTGIATDDTCKLFFGDLVTHKAIESYYGFKNEKFLFAKPVEHTVTFGLLTMLGSKLRSITIDTCWIVYTVDEMNNQARRVKMNPEDIALFNPNTQTCPTFRTSVDANLTRSIYERLPILFNETTGINTWNVNFLRMFDLTNDNHLFTENQSALDVPLYEGNMISIFDHRYATFDNTRGEYASNSLKGFDDVVKTQSFVSKLEAKKRAFNRGWQRNWYFGVRRIARNTDIRTTIGSFVPDYGVTYGLYLVMTNRVVLEYVALAATLNSFAFDYLCRTKLSQPSLTYGLLYQLPVLPPDAFSADDIAYIVPRVLELVYTAWDMRPFAEDVWAEATTDDRPPTTGGAGDHADDDADLSGFGRGVQAPQPNPTGLASISAEILRRNAECNAGAPAELFAPRDGFVLPPFRWDDTRRAHIRAELDARIARLYGLTRDELRYILDPADVYGPDFPGETFRVLKEKETKQFGEYRTRRLVLAAWDREEITHRAG